MKLSASIRNKLGIGLISQVLLIIIIIVSLIFLNARIKNISASSNLRMSESDKVQHLSFKLKDYFNKSLKYNELQTQYEQVQGSISNEELKSSLESIWKNIQQIEKLDLIQ